MVADLEALGNDAWIDHELSGGQAWWNQILGKIRDTDIFIFALASDALDSVACDREYKYALELGKPILPVLVAEGVSTNLLPLPLAETQIVDYRSQDRAAALSLARAIGSMPAPQPLPNPLPNPPEVPISYLGGLVERVNATGDLNFGEQSALLLDIKSSLRDPETENDGRALLMKMRKRRDLLATVGHEIDQILSGPQESPVATPAPAQSETKSEDAQSLPRVGKLRRLGRPFFTLGAFGVFGVLFFSLIAQFRKWDYDYSGTRSLPDSDAIAIALLTSTVAFLITVFANRISHHRKWVGVAICFVGFAALGIGIGTWLDALRVSGDGELAAASVIWGIGALITLKIALIKKRLST